MARTAKPTAPGTSASETPDSMISAAFSAQAAVSRSLGGYLLETLMRALAVYGVRLY